MDDGWMQLGIFLLGLATQGVVQYVAMARKLTQLCEQLSAVRERCRERGDAHKHHYECLERHGLALENVRIRLDQLEASRK